MKTQLATASRLFHASAEEIYNIIADYRNGHPHILPKPYFLSLDVEEGGFGAGTIVQFQMRLLGQTQSFRSLITEPEPGRVLVETDIKSGIPTFFTMEPARDDHQTRVTISTELKGRNRVEGFIAKVILQKVYRQELELLAKLVDSDVNFKKPAQTSSVHSISSE
jgi:hypothetical protein